MTVNPDGWTYIGWTDTEIPEETETKPAYYAPSDTYTVTENVTLYAVYSRMEEGVGAPVYNLVSSVPDDWSGTYVITYRTTNSSSTPMYLMKGVSVSSDGTAIEGTYNCDQYAVTGAVLNDTTLIDVSDTYVFTMEPHGSYYSMRNVNTGMYLGMNGNDYLSGYTTYTSGNCDWTPGVNVNASSAKIAKSSSYPLLTMYIDGPYFWAGSSNNTAALYVRFWKETNGDAIYYTTAPAETVHSHKMTHVPASAPSCDESGNKEYWLCSVCGKYFADEQGTNEISKTDVVIPALGHDFGDWTVTTAPTCELEGAETRACSRCDATESRPVPALGHSYGTPSYVWTQGSDCYLVTGKVVCVRDDSHVIEETVTAVYAVITEPANGVPGLGRYTAVFTDAHFTDQTMDVEIAAILLGDANCDGSVTVEDASLILRSIVGLNSLSAEGARNANVDGDDDITAQDAVTILRYIVKLIDHLPA